MSELSSAAQAVFNAYLENCDGAYNEEWYKGDLVMIAAALRATADQLQMKEPFGNTDADAGVFAAHQAIHAGLLAIAAELEAQ